MTASRIGGWLLVVLAIGGLVLAVPLVTAHGDGLMAGDDHHSNNATAADHADRMASHAGDHQGHGAHMVDGDHMSDGDHARMGMNADMGMHAGMTDDAHPHAADGDHRHARNASEHC